MVCFSKADEMEEITNEVMVHRTLHHPNVVEFIGAWKKGKVCCLILITRMLIFDDLFFFFSFSSFLSPRL